jgi:class 3 adenylate cyclase
MKNAPPPAGPEKNAPKGGCFPVRWDRIVASMSETDWSDLDVTELLPTGTVTLLLADVEGSTQLWESQPSAMTSAVAQLNRTASKLIAEHGGVRPVEQGEGDSFVAAFARASDAVACALDLQRVRLAPVKLRIGLHTGEVQLRDEGNYAGSTINKTARLRDLAHGGQTVMSAATEELVEDRLPENAWLTDLGRHPLRDLPRPMRVAQLCHPEVRNDFPPLRTTKTSAAKHLPTQLTTFIGRNTQMVEIGGHSGGQPAGYPDRRRRRGQDASRDRGCGQDDGRLSGRCLVCRPCTGGPSRGRTGHCRTGAGLARPTGQLDHGHGAALCPRPPHDAGAGQLRTPAGSERCTRDRHVGGLLEGYDPRDESRAAPRAG